MNAVEILLLSNAIIVLLLGALGTMFWSRLNRLEKRIDEIDLNLRGEMREVRTEVGMVRSDLTQIALAVGVRPRLVEE